MKLYLYGYTNQIRSSRRLEQEAGRNLELIWLLKNLQPGYRTIANFRKENWKALKAVNRSFVLLIRELGLVGGTLVAVDGALFHGNASKGSIFTRGSSPNRSPSWTRRSRLTARPSKPTIRKRPSSEATVCRMAARGDVGEKMKELMARRERAQTDLKNLETGDKGQLRRPIPTPGF